VVWLTTEADDQSSLHCVIVSTDVMSDHSGARRLTKCQKRVIRAVKHNVLITVGVEKCNDGWPQPCHAIATVKTSAGDHYQLTTTCNNPASLKLTHQGAAQTGGEV